MIRPFAIAGAFLFLAATPASAGSVAPLVTDLAGDANGLGLPHIPGGQVRALLGDALDQDPFGNGVATGPASYAPADILSIDYETEHVAIPVGEDGIDHRPTALVVRMRTAATPASPVGTTLFAVYQHLREEGGGVCRSSLSVSIPEGGGPGTYPVSWFQESQFESFCPRESGAYTDPAWTASVTAEGIVMHLPLSSIVGIEDLYVHEGGVIARTLGTTRSVSLVPQWDRTPFGADWTIGQDMPPDVPCTQGCPAA